MKSSESAIPDTAADTATGFSISGFIQEICSRFGPRLCGTSAEAQTAKFLASTLNEYCDEVFIEEHSFSPRSLDWGVSFFLFAYLAALASYLFFPLLSVVIILFSLVLFFFSRFRGYEILEQFFPQARTQNVTGKIRPTGERRRIVVFSGHHDSAYYMPLFEKRFQKMFFMTFFFLVSAHGILIAAALLRLLGSAFTFLLPISHVLFAISLVAGIIFVLFRIFLFQNVGVLGANDNLAAVGVVVALARYFASHRPEHVEIWAISFGAEEVGLRGSKRFAKKHRYELEDAIVINLEMVGAGTMVAVAGERMAGTKHSSEVVSLIVDAAKKCGIEMPTIVGPFGETDATSFTRRGIKASTIATFDKDGAPPNWHLLTDTPENIDEPHLQNAFRVCVECLNLIEQSCAKPAPGAVSAGMTAGK